MATVSKVPFCLRQPLKHRITVTIEQKPCKQAITSFSESEEQPVVLKTLVQQERKSVRVLPEVRKTKKVVRSVS